MKDTPTMHVGTPILKLFQIFKNIVHEFGNFQRERIHVISRVSPWMEEFFQSKAVIFKVQRNTETVNLRFWVRVVLFWVL